MFKRLKGYFKRVTTPKPDINYKPMDTFYGEFDIVFIYAIKYHDYTSIIIRINYDESNEDIMKEINTFKELLDIMSFSVLRQRADPGTALYIEGSKDKFITMINIFFINPKYTYNKIMRKLYNLLMRLDITSPYIILRNDLDSSEHNYSYETIEIKPQKEFYIQPMPDQSLNMLTTIIINTDKLNIACNIFELISRYYNDNDMNIISIVDDHYDEIKNIIGYNFKVTNQDNSDLYSDIDEVLD